MLEKLLVKKILEQATAYKWSVQGFGMLRLYLSDEVRLHLWDSTYRVRNVTDIHNHPWDFGSTVIAGQVLNMRYQEHSIEKWPFPELTELYQLEPVKQVRVPNYFQKDRVEIRCGEGSCTVSETTRVVLELVVAEEYDAPSYYMQYANEIHSSEPADGTVTIVERKFVKPRDYATVWTDPAKGFVSAEPVEATYEQVSGAARRSLERWF